MSILKSTDFKGEYSVSLDAYSELQTYIDKYEKFYLLRMLGGDLYTLFNVDLTAVTPQVPSAPIYNSLFNSFEMDDEGCLLISEGIKQMLVQLVYYHFIMEGEYSKTKSGVQRGVSENSNALAYIGFNLIDAYNAGIKNIKSIQRFIVINSTDYPTYKGIWFDYSSGI